MTAAKAHIFAGSSLGCVLLLSVFAQSGAFARAGSFPRDEPWNAEHIDRLPPEVRESVAHMCEGRPNAAHYFATYLDHAKIIRLHFEHFICEGRPIYHQADQCLHEEFILVGSHYQLLKNYRGRCDD